jgi:hypothetical protein
VTRRVVTLLFALSLALTLFVGALWVRGFWRADEWWARRCFADGDDVVAENAALGTDSRRIVVLLQRARIPADAWQPTPHPLALSHRVDRSPPFSLAVWREGSFLNRLGFSCSTDDDDSFDAWQGSIPTWFAFALCALATAAFGRAVLLARRRRRRAAGGQCVTCGYDLRGAQHERCPECGELVAAPAQV